MLAAFGLAISIYAPSVVMLLFTIGVCTGAGFGLIYLPAIVSVTCYFDRKRAFATGIAVCGSGVGAAIFAPFTDMLIKALGWKGSMVIIAVLVLTCSIFGILFRPLEIEYEDADEEDEEAGVLCEEEEVADSHLNFMVEHEKNSRDEISEQEEEALISISDKRRASEQNDSIFEEEEPDEKNDRSLEVAMMQQLPSSLPKATMPSHGLRTRRKLMIPSNRSDVNLKLMIPSEQDTSMIVMHPGACSVTQTAPVQDSPSRHLSFSNAFKGLQSHLRGSFNDSTNTVIANTPTSIVAGSRMAIASGSRAAFNRSTSKMSSHANVSQSSSKRKLAGSSALLGPLARADIFYSRSTLNLPQSQSKSRSNVMIYTASSAAVSDHFKKSQAVLKKEETDDIEKDEDVSDAMDEEGKMQRAKRINFSRQVTVEQPAPDCNQSMAEELEEEMEMEEETKSITNKCCPEEMIQMFKLMMDFKILSNPVFLMFAISNFITSLGYYVPHIYLKDKAMDALGEENISTGDASNLIAMVGIGSTIGRLLFGYLSDFPSINRLTLYNVCLTICGISVICTSFTTTYAGLATYSTIFGLFCGQSD